jgi:CelD/BcsL family acetyltransferase involved in cellulose biosynthesis
MATANLASATRYDFPPRLAPRQRLADTPAAGVEISVYDDLAAAESTWRAFQREADCTVFQTFDWLSAWQRHVGQRNGLTPAIVVARDATDAVLMILPLATRRLGPARELVWLGAEVCDYNAPLLAPDFAKHVSPGEFSRIWQDVVCLLQSRAQTAFDMIRLEKMPETARAQKNPMLELATTLNPSGSYAAPLASSWDSFYAAKRSSSTRRRDRAKRKKLSEFGEIKLVTAKLPAEALEILSVLVKQKSAQFARLGIANLFARPGYLEFLRDFAGNALASGLCHVSALRIGSQIAAANFALTFGGRYSYVLSSYGDGDMAKLGPGAVHLQELMRYAIDNQFTVFDFTIGDERYKLDWCEGAQPLHDHVVASSWRGTLVAAPLLVSARLKRTIKQTPVLWALFTRLRALAARLRMADRAAIDSAGEAP